MKKKLLTIMLVVAMVLGMNTVAFAAEPVTSVNFTKTYTSEEWIGEKLTFAVVGNNDNGAPTVTVETDNTYLVTDKTNSIKINAVEDADTKMGTYKYTITETPGSTQGAEYNTGDKDVIAVEVLVNNDKKVENIVVAIPEGDSVKNYEIQNTYNTGILKVKKEVTGNMSTNDDEFKVKVTFAKETGKTVIGDITYVDDAVSKTISAADLNNAASKEVEITLKGEETVEFTGIPYGVTIDVTEDALSLGNYKQVSGNTGDNDIVMGENTDGNTVTIVNDYTKGIETGVIVNNMPYIVALVVLAAVAVVFFRRRREF